MTKLLASMRGIAMRLMKRTSCVSGKDSLKPSQASSECSDDEPSPSCIKGEKLECPICWESFNIVENVPYVLWCGHTLCKNCVLGLRTAIVKFSSLPHSVFPLPFFISCPWCNLLSFRLVLKGNLRFPCKNYFLLWMVESMNVHPARSSSSFSIDPCRSSSSFAPGNCAREADRAPPASSDQLPVGARAALAIAVSSFNTDGLQSCFQKCLLLFLHVTSKLPLMAVVLFVAACAIPASAAIVAIYILVTILFALPSFLILYFSFPGLDWLLRELID